MSDAIGGLAYLAGLVDAATFGLAALAKWRDPAGTARAFRDLGVPRPWLAARLLPPLEAALALGLVVLGGPAAVAAAPLLALFGGFLALRLRDGVRAPCHCFGGWRRHPLSAADVVRTVALLAAALLATTSAGPTAPTPGAVALTGLGVGASWAVVGSTRRASVRRASGAGSHGRPEPG